MNNDVFIIPKKIAKIKYIKNWFNKEYNNRDGI